MIRIIDSRWLSNPTNRLLFSITISGTTELDSVERLEQNATKWNKCCKLPLARSNAGVCSLYNRIYCIGGWNGQIGIKQCDVYRPLEDKWTSMSSLQTGRYQAGVAAYKNKIWAAGGSDAWNILSSVETFDPDTDKWTYGPPLLTPRRGCGLAEFNGKMYAVGGSDGTHSLSSVEIYDEENQTWVFGPSLTMPRANVSVASVFGKLYAIGGFAGKNFLNTMEYLDPNTNEWTTFVRQQGDNQQALIEQELVEKISELHLQSVALADDNDVFPPLLPVVPGTRSTIAQSNGHHKRDQNGTIASDNNVENHRTNENGDKDTLLATIDEHTTTSNGTNGSAKPIVS